MAARMKGRPCCQPQVLIILGTLVSGAGAFVHASKPDLMRGSFDRIVVGPLRGGSPPSAGSCFPVRELLRAAHRALNGALREDAPAGGDRETDPVASEVRFGRGAETRRLYFAAGTTGGTVVQGASATTPTAGKDGPARHLIIGAWARLKHATIATFLPAGFPASLPPEYLRYQAWNVVQDLSSSLRGVLCTQKILEGMGVGNAAMTSLAATMLWMAKDGSAMLGGLAFTAAASQHFGADVKRWRLFADLINDVALFMDMIAPMYPHLFLPIICLSSVFKAMCGVSAGACNSAISQHLASVKANIAEVSAKGYAQHTMVNIIALPLGIVFAKMANVSPLSLWSSFGVLTAVHVWGCITMMRTLTLTSLSLNHLQQLLPPIMIPLLRGAANSEEVSVTAAAATPQELARTERLFWTPGNAASFPRLKFGVPLKELTSPSLPLTELLAVFRAEAFVLSYHAPPSNWWRPSPGEVRVAVTAKAQSADLLRAAVAAFVLEYLGASYRDNKTYTRVGGEADAPILTASPAKTGSQLVIEALRLTDRLMPEVRAKLSEAGWKMHDVSLGQPAWLASW